VLVLDEETNARVKKLRDFAETPENYHLIGPGGTQASIPGDNPNFVTWLKDGFRVVFTITKADDGLWRQLSISVHPANKKYANPFAAFTIAKLFGFTGWDEKTEILPPDWLGRQETKVHAVMLAQRYIPHAKTD
jgi:hypothetical protein